MNTPHLPVRRLAYALCTALVLGVGASAALQAAAPEEEEEAVRTAVALLLANQEDYVADRPVGRIDEAKFDAWQEREKARLKEVRAAGPGHEWPYEGVHRVGRGVIPSGYRVGGTAIVCESLIAVEGYEEDEDRQAAVGRAVEFILDQLANEATLEAGPKEGYDVRGWGHTYALSLFLKLIDGELLSGDRLDEVRDRVLDLIDRLVVNESPDGGWNYANDRTHSPFQTGATLLALFEARRQGFEVPKEMVERALDALATGRRQDTGAYAYSGRGRSEMHASAARAAIAELCLFRAGRSSVDDLRRAVAGFHDGWYELEKRKSQQGTHEGPYNIAPYYFFFGHTYAALAAEYLPEDERPEWRARMHAALWRTREDHGGWNDRIFPRTESFSTAMALQALLARNLPAVAEWPEQ